ncbi:MAG: hypothetical protein K2X03_25820 [Bryobacteraceae bacterium]|nr:hypothetical protein [Bryobacteraceae bacterium]
MMTHPNEEQLMLYYYGECPEAAATTRHLEECEACRAGYQALQRVLNSVDSLPVPDRAADYETLVWGKLSTHLAPSQSWPWRWYRPLAACLALAALLLTAFLAGRISHHPAPPSLASAAQLRERVLLVALGAHLERTRMLLVEFANAEPRAGHFEIAWEQGAAEELLEANRLYRQSAANSGDIAATRLLEELEGVMVELAHSPVSLPAARFEELRARIEERSLLFKLNVLQADFARRESAPANIL